MNTTPDPAPNGMRVPPVTVVLDRVGYAYCVPCAEARSIEADAVYVADNAAAADVVCDGCGGTGYYDRKWHVDPVTAPSLVDSRNALTPWIVRYDVFGHYGPNAERRLLGWIERVDVGGLPSCRSYWKAVGHRPMVGDAGYYSEHRGRGGAVDALVAWYPTAEWHGRQR